HTSIPVAEAREFYPLSSAQKRLYILHQLEGAELSYNMSGEVLIEGPLDRERVEKAFREMIHRHESLRTGFEMIEGEPVQKIYPEIPFHLELYKSDDEGAQEIIRSFVRIFDLEKAPLLRVGLTEITSERHILMLDMHHIISDGISIAVIIDEFVQLYEGKDLLPLRIQYKDYAVWQRKEFDSERLKKQEAYWVDTLAGESPVLELPTDYTRPAVKNFAGATFYFDLDPRIEEGLRQIASQTESTLYMVLLAAYKTLLHKYSRQEDIIVGTPIAGRTHADLEPLIGMFVNTLAIRSYPSEEKTFLEFLAELKETTLLAYENQEYPFEELVELVDVTRDLSRNALFDTMFVLQNTEQGTLEIEGLHLQEYPQEYTMAKFDLTLTIDELESGLTCQMEYATSLYREETIERMSRHFVQLLESIVENPQHTLASLELILPEEREQILRVFNNSEADYPREKTIQQLFEEQAARAPERIAVIHENQVITYGELNERANRLARTLRAEGVQADHLVAIMVERSVDMLVGIIAILKAGGAYVPLDPEYPEDRLYYMLEDSGAQVLLTQRHLEDRLSYSGTKLVLDDDASYHEDGSNLASVNQPQNLAYVIYTSGTTGKPKGTLIEHKNVVRLLFNDHNLFDFNENDVWTLFHSYCFDFSVWEMYGALLYGGKVVVVPSLTAKNPKQFLQLLKDQQVTILNQTPTYFYKVLQEEAAEGGKGLALRNVIFGGEALSPYLLKDWKSKYPHIQLINMYGITETTVHVTYKEITEVEIEQAKSNIGQPIPTLSTYILDEHRNLLPVGVMGELYVAGEGVARGYLNRPDLTAEKFVDNPFKPGERMYRSGDLARWLPDGNLEYLGRIDHQVKIRGFRIELGEVESQLLKLDSMREGIVLAQKDEAGQEDLCAYFTAEREWNVSELRTALSQELPSYMIPSYFVQLEQMPLTPNGKVDRRALPKPTTGLQTGTEYVAPRTEIEEKLVQVWQEVLGVATIGVKDNFFDLGGHSLRATTLVSKIHKELNIDLALRTIFQAPTVEELAQIVSETEQNKHISIPRAMEREVYPVSSAQKRLYILHQLEGAELSYNISGQLLLEGSLDRNKVEEVFRKLIARHETLRTSFEIEHGEPVQRIHPNVSFTLEYVQSSDDEAQERIRQFVRAFDLGVAPLFRAGLIELEEKRFILMLDMHHIISDGVSIERITEEFAKLYEGHELPPLRIQYKDYAVWQQSEVQSERIQKQGEYWLDSLKGELPVLELPTDYARPAVQSFMGETYDFVIDSSLSKSLKQLTNQTGTTLHMLLLAVYKTLLHKYSGQEDIIVGTPIAGRTHSDLEPLLGMFVNTLAIRSYPSGAKGFIDFLSEVKETTLLAYENQEYPFEELVEHVNVSRDLSRNAIFDTMFVLESTAQNDLNLKDIKMQDYPYGDQMAKFDLSLTIEESAEGLQCNMEYATSLYSERTIKRMADHFVKLIEAIITNPQNNLSSLEIMLSQEREEILYVFNEREAVFSHEKTIQQLFEEQVNRTPDSIAVVYENQELTYSKLNQRANQLAHTLRAKGVQPEQPVGIIAHRSVEMVVGILAILKAGGAYIPIDPEYPEERIHYILKNSNAEVLLLQQNVLDQLDFAG
ncbi:non-ribosomal peptide synthetase, partial [Caldalkalibacillus mannanilyticus]|uniref:non-ribosomal peptide synthetase n=1 Tax=Caldalkalibacillus mannanilyticus TaxID=1418 RepID=UPI00046A856E